MRLLITLSILFLFPVSVPARSPDLLDYVALALQRSDAAQNIRDSLVLRKLDLEMAGHHFELQWVPQASVGFRSGADTQALGLEARRQTTLGPNLVAGIRTDRTASDRMTSETYGLSGYLRVTQGIFRRWGREYTRASLTRAEIGFAREQLLAERRRQEIILSSVQHFHNVLLSARLIEKNLQALERSRANLEMARSRQSVGLVSKVDVYRAELAVLTAENMVQEQQRAHRRNIEAFYEQIGQGPGDSFVFDAEVVPLIPVLPDQWEEDLLMYRADWQAQELDRRLAELSLSMARRNTLPDVDLIVEYSQRGTGMDYDAVLRNMAEDSSFQIQLRSAFDTVREQHALTRELMNIDRLERQQATIRRQIQREAREALQDLVAEENRRSIIDRQLEQAHQALELATLRYERGLSSNLDMLDAEIAFSEAEMNLLQIRVSCNLAAVRLGYALGILDVTWLELALAPDTLSFEVRP